MENEKLADLPGLLLPWYEQNKRDLPWRKDREAYHIWVSEIMLQQTRVEAVRGYYRRFLDRLPTIDALAGCDDDVLTKLWEGLGYYSRVRNMKKAAGCIMTQHGGVFPGEYEKVLALPGIGEYTAGAICSIAYDLPTPAVDGNVLRLLSRLTDDPSPIDQPQTKAAARKTLEAIYPRQAGIFTQALMELGATVCGPNRAPDCCNCPCREICLAYLHGTADDLPVKAPKKARRTEEMTVYILCCDGKYALQKRPDHGLLASLWQFPNEPGLKDAPQAVAKAEALGLRPRSILRMTRKKHIFTHITWQMQGCYLEVAEPLPEYTWLTAEQVEQTAALPTAFRQFWEEIHYV